MEYNPYFAGQLNYSCTGYYSCSNMDVFCFNDNELCDVTCNGNNCECDLSYRCDPLYEAGPKIIKDTTNKILYLNCSRNDQCSENDNMQCSDYINDTNSMVLFDECHILCLGDQSCYKNDIKCSNLFKKCVIIAKGYQSIYDSRIYVNGSQSNIIQALGDTSIYSTKVYNNHPLSTLDMQLAGVSSFQYGYLLCVGLCNVNCTNNYAVMF